MAEERLEEWRYHLAARVTGGPKPYIMAAETIRYGEETFEGFRAPSTPAFFLSLALKHRDAVNDTLTAHEQDLGAIEYPKLFDLLESMLASIVFAYSSLEAVANEEIPSDFV